MSTIWQLAFVLLFLCVLAEGIAILALARAIGLLQLRLGPAPAALQTADGLALYREAPAVSGFDLRLQRPVTLDVSSGRWALIFAGATCRDCRQLVREVGWVDKDSSWGTRIAVVAEGTHEQNAVLAKSAPDLLLLSDPHGDMQKAYEVESTPYAFLIEDGQVQAKGIVNHRDHLEALLEGATTQREDLVWTRVGDASPQPAEDLAPRPKGNWPEGVLLYDAERR